VTKCVAAYEELFFDLRIEIEISDVKNIRLVNADLGTDRSIIFFHDGSTANILESANQLAEFW
jgi:hypothetical protein